MPDAAILVTTFEGSPSVDELAAAAARGERPRKDYVELSRAVPSVVVDAEYMRERATAQARAVARRAGMPAGQIAEAFARRNRFGPMLAWADRLGLPLAALFKATRSRRDLVLISVLLSTGSKAQMLGRLRVHTHLGALVAYSSKQLDIAGDRFGVPREKLHAILPAIDERFWTPRPAPTERLICAVGLEQRDYATLFNAVDGLDVRVEIALGSIGVPPWATAGATVPPPPRNVEVRTSLSPPELRELYARAQVVVVPLNDVEFDAGGTVISEAMAMGKAVVATRTRGQTDLVRDGENGRFVPPRDVRALRATVEQLLDRSGEAEGLGRAARELVERRQTLDQHVAFLARLLQRQS